MYVTSICFCTHRHKKIWDKRRKSAKAKMAPLSPQTARGPRSSGFFSEAAEEGLEDCDLLIEDLDVSPPRKGDAEVHKAHAMGPGDGKWRGVARTWDGSEEEARHFEYLGVPN